MRTTAMTVCAFWAGWSGKEGDTLGLVINVLIVVGLAITLVKDPEGRKASW